VRAATSEQAGAMHEPSNLFPASFDHTEPAVGPDGQLPHPLAIEHLDWLAPKVYKVG